MTTGYKISEQDKLYFVTLQVVEWVDVFTRESYRKIIIENLAYCQNTKDLKFMAG
jgi:putative transposase